MRDVLVADACAALIEDGAFGGLEDDVVAGVAFVELALNFLREVILFVLGLPIAVRQVVEIYESAINDDR